MDKCKEVLKEVEVVYPEVAKAIEAVEECFDYDYEEILKRAFTGKEWTQEDLKPLNTISPLQLARALLIGYKVKTREEMLLEYYNRIGTYCEEPNPQPRQLRETICDVLRILGITIKGINDM